MNLDIGGVSAAALRICCNPIYQVDLACLFTITRNVSLVLRRFRIVFLALVISPGSPFTFKKKNPKSNLNQI